MPHTRFLTFVLTLGIGVCPARAADPADTVKDKLYRAKKSYDSGMDQYRKQVGEWLDTREEFARKEGNKKSIDQIKNDRKTFDESGDLPKSAPVSIRQKRAAAKKDMEAAYEEAIKELTKAKLDDEAAKVERALDEFRIITQGSSPDPFQAKSIWVSKTPKFTLTVSERKGDTFRANFLAGGGTVEREVSGTIKNGKLMWLAKDTLAIKGGQGHDNYGTLVTDKSGSKIDFTYGTANKPPTGMYTLRLLKESK